jgi:hypothetical protein
LKYTPVYSDVGAALNVEISSGIAKMLNSYYYFLFVLIVDLFNT